MFNRELRIRTVSTKKADNDSTVVNEPLNPETIKLIEETGSRFIKRAVATVAVAVVAVKVLDILGDVIVKKTKSADNE